MYYNNELPSTWISQANYIFTRLQIISNHEDYLLVTQIVFGLRLLTTAKGAPPGFLFICPESYFQIGPSAFRCPTSPAYWSLDPLGVDRLSREEATLLGFPAIGVYTDISGLYWDNNVYAGLRKFHRAKGFDPESQDVARHLGHPLYQLTSEIDAPAAHGRLIIPTGILL
ncbi:hypothetical protein DFH09DRAFT_1043777 [Mycena vulgaris]|nr:hypothetical protein DFH09DRAFT_1043777 [Mycena vulgaris]